MAGNLFLFCIFLTLFLCISAYETKVSSYIGFANAVKDNRATSVKLMNDIAGFVPVVFQRSGTFTVNGNLKKVAFFNPSEYGLDFQSGDILVNKLTISGEKNRRRTLACIRVSAGTVELRDSTVTDCYNKRKNPEGMGGGAEVTGGQLKIKRGTFLRGSATVGGGIAIPSLDARVIICFTRFEDSSIIGFRGKVIYSASPAGVYGCFKSKADFPRSRLNRSISDASYQASGAQRKRCTNAFCRF